MRSKRELQALGLVLLLTLAVILLPSPALAATDDGWGTSRVIVSDPRGDSHHAEVAVDASGGGLAVWQLEDGVTTEVLASHYEPGQGWSYPDRPLPYWGGAALDPDVGVDSLGNGMAVWQHDWQGQYQIAIALYIAGQGWQDVRQVGGNLSADQRDPEVAVARDGAAAVVWTQCCDPGWQVWGNVFDPDSGWSGAAQINVGSAVNAKTPRVGVDQRGGAVAIWIEDAVSTSSLNGSRYSPGVGWSLPVPVETAPVEYVAHPALAVDDAGDALALWERTNGTTDIVANHLAQGAWETAAVVGASPQGPSEAPRVAMDASGNGMGVWHSYTAVKNTIIARTFDSTLGWGGMTQLENVSYDQGRASPDVSMDAAGNALAVWVEGDSQGFSIEGAHYSPALGWSGPAYAEGSAGAAGHEYNSGGPPRVALGPGGRALLTWMGLDGGRYAVWGNTFTWPDSTPPTLEITFPATGSTTNRSVTPVSGTTEPGARVSVNGIELAVGAEGSFYVDLGLRPGANVIVAVATDAAGNTAYALAVVNFDDPVPQLEAQLLAAQVSLQEASAEVAAAQARLDDLTNRTDASQAELDAAQANLTAAQAQAEAAGVLAASLGDQLADARALLNQTRIELAASQAQLAGTQADLAATQGDLAATREELAAARSEFNASNGSVPPPSAAPTDLGPAIALGLAGIGLGSAGLLMAVNTGRRTRKPPAA